MATRRKTSTKRPKARRVRTRKTMARKHPMSCACCTC